MVINDIPIKATDAAANTANVGTGAVVKAEESDAELAVAVVYGDVNCDGAVNILDVDKLYAYVRGQITISENTVINAANVNKDADMAVNILDVDRLYAYIRGQIPSL
jgi:hypothetical protein